MSAGSYIESISTRYALGNSTEHTFRGDLQQLIESMVAGIAATNEPKRIECGAPDYVVTRKEIPIGYIEAKDIGEDLKGAKIKEQRDRYKEALDNLIFTDYLDFHLYRNGELKFEVRIAEVRNGKIAPINENLEAFANLIKEFSAYKGQTIKSSKALAEMMAEKAKMLAYIIRNALTSDEESEANSTLKDQMKAFQQILIHDLDPRGFADVYAQTIAYGMFAARLHDPSLETFSRREAAELIPKTNPFLRKLFNNIATDIDERIEWIVDALADVFRAADIAAILKNFGKSTQTHDPIMHFYETFLAAYDPKLRKSRGVFYTPEPVVDFIVRAVDDILKTEFGLPTGLADTSKIRIKVDQQGRMVEKEVHKVQILDPATGTGTFLAQVIKQIHKSFENQQGVWNQYVDEHLIPRLNGFELLMASYAMAHLKLDMLLTELNSDAAQPLYLRESTAFPADGRDDESGSAAGGKAADHKEGETVKQSFTANRQAEPASQRSKRFQIYLTNALEEYHPETGTLWASWLSAEANEANHIKRDTPVMVVIGNPPYSGESDNKGEWIMSLMEDYKKEPGGKEKLKERNPKWINDDYVKFLRFGQYLIEKNGEGVLAFINPHGFLDNPTFRGMRWNLLKTFDKIYTLDLHGNVKKRETAYDGTPDENVFDIQQGVSINIFLKRAATTNYETAHILHYDLFGKRESKYDFLTTESLNSVPFVELPAKEPSYFLVAKDFALGEVYATGFSITELFPTNTVGVVTANDGILVNERRELLIANVRKHYDLEPSSEFIVSNAYRPFDNRLLYYDVTLIERARAKVMRHLRSGKNLGLASCRQLAVDEWNHIGIVDRIMDDCRLSNRTKERGYVFPLYLFPNSDQGLVDVEQERIPNLNMDIVGKIAQRIGLEFSPERVRSPNVNEGANAATERGALADARATDTEARAFAPIDILDYIYAVLHSPTYRAKYKEFLKIDFPRVPYPKDRETFWQLVELGSELRGIHLLESPAVNRFITGYPVAGNNEVVKPEYKNGSVFINATQYFSNVPEAAWSFYIGGYQPAQKWLKDRKGRTLNFEDIQHYQKIIVALTETDRVMKEIDKIDFLDAA